MNSQLSRRTVLSFMGLAAVPTTILAMPDDQDNGRPAPLDKELVRKFVSAAHGDLDLVKELLAETPGLLNAVHDWGGGDFEAAIGGAGHMGRRDIADYLIGKGAKTTLFVHTMFGETDVVKAALTQHPQLAQTRGPHGLTMKFHAKKGGEQAKELLEYLESLEA